MAETFCTPARAVAGVRRAPGVKPARRRIAPRARLPHRQRRDESGERGRGRQEVAGGGAIGEQAAADGAVRNGIWRALARV